MSTRIKKLEKFRNGKNVLLNYINPNNLATTVYTPLLTDEKNDLNKPKLEEFYNIKEIKFIEK